MIFNLQFLLTRIFCVVTVFSITGLFQNLISQVPVDGAPSPLVPEDNTPIELGSDELGLGILSDPAELSMVDGLDEPLERLRLRDQDTNGILDMIQLLTGKYILRPQNLPQVKVNFDSFSILTKRETLLALDSLLAMNGIGMTKIDERFYKAVPAAGMNVHVPIWLETS